MVVRIGDDRDAQRHEGKKARFRRYGKDRMRTWGKQLGCSFAWALFVGIGVMSLGPLLRVQLYLCLGFVGFATDQVALVVKQFRAFDSSIQVVGAGALLWLLGIIVVGGAISPKPTTRG